jgi:hypothetical protein
MAIIHEFKAIKRVLERQEQKADFDAKNPEPLSLARPYGLAVPFVAPTQDPA